MNINTKMKNRRTNDMFINNFSLIGIRKVIEYQIEKVAKTL